MDALTGDNDHLKGDAKIIADAKKRFERCQTWESYCRSLADEDEKFVTGDSDNHFQWPGDMRQRRELDQQPCLTINKTRQHCLQVINDAKQNKPGVKISPVGGGATFEAAQVFDGIVRHIEYTSNAESVYDSATEKQVYRGIGYWRIITDYADENTFDQEIFIRRIKDPRSVYLDPDIRERDGSDAKFGFVFDDVPKDAFLAEYPDCDEAVNTAPLGNGDGWITKDHVRVCEYYVKGQKKDKLVAFINPGLVSDENDGQQIMRESELKKQFQPEIVDAIMKDPETKIRKIMIDDVQWYKIAADKIIDRRPWLGAYVPIARVVGEENVIDGKYDCKGHVRDLKDAQRQYNYWSSGATESVALQAKSPWIGATESIEGYEDVWKSANRVNHSLLAYNHMDEQGNVLPPPQRVAPPMMGPAFIKGLEISQNEMMMASGQFQSQMGENENAKSGVAINARQRQGDNATYHFIDNLAVAIRFTGKMLIDLIPKVYDTPRVIKILARDGTASDVQLDPDAQKSYFKEQQQTGEEVKAIFNPSVGKYAIVSEIGPAYATKRQQAFEAFTEIIRGNPDLMKVAGDLMFKAADFPMADELAERLKKLVPPELTDEAPPAEFVQAMEQSKQQIAALTQALTAAIEQLADKERELKDKSAEIDVKQYDAETRRVTGLSNAVPEIGLDALKGIIVQVLAEMNGAPEMHSDELAEAVGFEDPMQPQEQEQPQEEMA